MKCDIKIMASPARSANVANLCKKLGLVMTKDVFFDDRPNGGDAYYTSRKTFEMESRNNATHRCVLQDDVMVCNGFEHIVNELVRKRPNAFWTLFCSSMKLIEMRAKNPNIRIVKIKRCGMYGQAIIAPIGEIEKVYAWGEAIADGRKIVHDDVLFGEYALHHDMPVYTTLPGLVQHLAPTNSLLGFNNKGKVSKVFDVNADRFSWNTADDELSISLPNTMEFCKAAKGDLH